MSAPAVQSHRCSNCGAPLKLERLKNATLQCLFCGSSHSLEQESQELKALGNPLFHPLALVASAVIGFMAFHASREFYHSLPAPWSTPIIAGIFIALGLKGKRVPAALGLFLVGLLSVVKPFILPAPYYESSYPLQTEPNMMWLVPGVISLVVGFAFFASLKMREAGPAVRAARPGLVVVIAAVSGFAMSFFTLPPSLVQMASAYHSEVVALHQLAKDACNGDLEEHVDSKIVPSPIRVSPPSEVNMLFASCALIEKKNSFQNYTNDRNDQLGAFLRTDLGRVPREHRKATDRQKKPYENLLRYRFLIVYSAMYDNDNLLIIDKDSRSVIRKASMPGLNPSNDDEDIRNRVDLLIGN